MSHMHESVCIHASMHIHTYVDGYVGMQKCMSVYVYVHVCMFVFMHTYICHGNKYVPHYSRILIFWWGNPSLLDYDDVIMLCC